MKILEVQNLVTEFRLSSGVIRAVDDVSFSLEKGKVLGIVGESGCGKTVTALSILRLVDDPGKIVSGKILLDPEGESGGVDLLQLPEKEMLHIRGNKIAMIFQEPMTSLNPVYTVGDQIMEAILLHQGLGKKEAREKTIEILRRVGIPDAEHRVDDYPHQMSGGMRQRVMIAMALSCEPEVLIADEPTTALDVTIQAQILDLIQKIIEEMNMALILITHDLGVVAETCDSVLVMYAGKVVEEAPARILFSRPKHPYTIGLMESIPSLIQKEGLSLKAIQGSVPDLLHLPPGCRFRDRCPRAVAACDNKIPSLRYVGAGQLVRCINA
jgi:oligopeptide transport system ATP-binding protein